MVDKTNMKTNEFKPVSYTPNFRVDIKNDKYLLTSEHGEWLFLSKEDFKKKYSNKSIFDNLKKKGLIITKSNSDIIIRKLRKKKSFLFSGPALHIVVVTLRCDQKCIYCHASSKCMTEKQYDMSFETADKVVDFIFQSNSDCLNIEFQGGEPLVNFEVVKHIIEKSNEKNKLAKKDLRFSLPTNFSLMTDEILDFLIKNNVMICTSLDGPENVHNKNRAKYKETVFWVDKINNEYKKRSIHRNVDALLTVTKYSLNFSKEIVDEYLLHNIHSIHLRPLKKLGDARKNIGIYYSIDNFIDFWKKSLDYIIQLNFEGRDIIERQALVIIQKLFLDRDSGYVDLRSPCGAIIGQVLYDFNGKIYTCDEGRMLKEDIFSVGNVTQTLKEVTTCKESCAIISASINDSYYCDNCVYKPFCGVCPVLNYAEFGSVIGRISESDWCKLNKAQFDYIFKKLEDKNIKDILMSWVNRKV